MSSFSCNQTKQERYFCIKNAFKTSEESRIIDVQLFLDTKHAQKTWKSIVFSNAVKTISNLKCNPTLINQAKR